MYMHVGVLLAVIVTAAAELLARSAYACSYADPAAARVQAACVHVTSICYAKSSQWARGAQRCVELLSWRVQDLAGVRKISFPPPRRGKDGCRTTTSPTHPPPNTVPMKTNLRRASCEKGFLVHGAVL